jgi:zinc/manganese transport system permease protein
MFSGFMVNAWIAASIVAVVAGAVGFFVVVRGTAFAAHALPLGAFPGAAAARLLGLDEFIGLIAFAGLGVIGISTLGRRNRHDVATALSLVMLLGLGALFLSLTPQYAQHIYALFFGEVLGVSGADLRPVALFGGMAIFATLIFFRPLLLSAVSADLAQARGVSPRWLDLLFLGIIALATAVTLPVVGALLVFSLMVGPASAARALSPRPGPAMALSVLLALVTAWAALALSYVSDWPVGFFVGALGALWYGLGRIVSGRWPKIGSMRVPTQ